MDTMNMFAGRSHLGVFGEEWKALEKQRVLLEKARKDLQDCGAIVLNLVIYFPFPETAEHLVFVASEELFLVSLLSHLRVCRSSALPDRDRYIWGE